MKHIVAAMTLATLLAGCEPPDQVVDADGPTVFTGTAADVSTPADVPDQDRDQDRDRTHGGS